MSSRANHTDVGVLLKQFSEGDPRGSEQLLSLLYVELHALAERMMANQPMGQTLQATALVSEAYLRLARTRGRAWEGRAASGPRHRAES